MTPDQHSVHAAIETMTQSFQNGDIARVMASYEAQATVVFDPAAPASAAADIEHMFRTMATLSPVFDYPAGHEVIANGDIALHIAPWSMTAKTPDGADMAQSGLSVAVLRKQPDGAWKMVIDHPQGGRLLAAE